LLLLQKDRAAAKQQVVAVLRDKPDDYAIDAVAFPPDVLALAYEVRVELARSKGPPAQSAPVAPVAAPSSQAQTPRPAIVWLPAWLGAAATIAGGVLIGIAVEHHQRLNAGSMGSVTNGLQLASEGSAFQTAGSAALAAGLLVLAAGVVLLLLTK
jgi:hypothetical protein